MSEEVRRLLDEEIPRPEREVERLVASGQTRALTEGALERIGAGDALHRQRALDRLEQVSPSDRLLPFLIDALRDAERVERRNAARSALARLAGSGRVSQRLAQLAAYDPDRDVRILAATALGESRQRTEDPGPLLEATHDEDPAVAAAAAEALGALGDPRALRRLIEMAAHEDPWLRSAAVVALGRMEDADALPVLLDALADPLTAEPAATAVERIGDASALERLRPLLSDEDERVREHALRAAAALVALAGQAPEAVPSWLRAAASRRVERSEFAEGGTVGLEKARLLGLSGTAASAAMLIAAAGDAECWPHVVVGLELLPAGVRARAVLDGLGGADPDTVARLIGTLADLDESAAVERVVSLLSHDAAAVRGAAEDALMRSERELVVSVLDRAHGRLEERAGPDERTTRARVSITRLLARLDPSRCFALTVRLKDADAAVRIEAARGLEVCSPEAVRGDLIEALERETQPQVREALIGAVGTAGGDEAVRAISALIPSGTEAERFAAAQALGRSRSLAALAPLLGLLDDTEPSVRLAALHALGQLGDPRGAQPLAQELTARDVDVRRTAAAALESLATDAARARLLDALEDEDWRVRLSAVRALRLAGGPAERRRLQEIARSDRDALVRREAAGVRAREDDEE